MKITIILPHGKRIKLDVNEDDSIEDLKSKLEDSKGFPVDQQILIFDTMKLEDSKTLKDYSIKNDSTIMCVDKNRSLLLKTSNGFNGSTLIDHIHQSLIDLQMITQEKDVIYLLTEAISYLDDDLDFITMSEIFSLILTCFSIFPEQSLKTFQVRFEKPTIAVKHIIILSSILCYIASNRPQIQIDFYNDFINNSFQEIKTQLQKENVPFQSNNPLNIFGFDIPKEYKKMYIENTILLVNLTEEIVKCSYPIIFSVPINSTNLNVFIQKVVSAKLITAIPEEAFLKDDLYSNLTNDNIAAFISIMSEQNFKKTIFSIEKVIQENPLTTNLANSFINTCSKFSVKSNVIYPMLSFYNDFNSSTIYEYFDKNQIYLNFKFITRYKNYVNIASELTKTPLLDNFTKSPLLLKITQNPEVLPAQYVSYALLNGKDIDFYNKTLSYRRINSTIFSTIEFWKHILIIVSSTTNEITDQLMNDLAFYFSNSVSLNKVFNFFSSLIFDTFPPNKKQSDFLNTLLHKLPGKYIKEYYNGKYDTVLLSLLNRQTLVPPPSCCQLFRLNCIAGLKTITPNILYEYVFSNKNNKNVTLKGIEIMPMTHQPSELLIQFIQQNNNFDLITNIDKESLSLIACSLYYAINQNVSTISNLNETNILPFYAIALSFIEKNEQISFTSKDAMLHLLVGAIMNFNKNPSPLSIASINSIISKMCLLLNYDVLPSETVTVIFDYLISFALKGEFRGDESMLILDIFKYSCEDIPSEIFYKYGINIFKYILKNLSKFITKSEQFDGYLLNLALFDPKQVASIIINLIQSASEYEEVYYTALFLRRHCKYSPQLQFSDRSKLDAAVEYAVSEEKWNDVFVLFQFMNFYEIPIDKEAIKGKEIPFDICTEIFKIIKQVDADDLVNHILTDPKLEKDSYLFNAFYSLLMQNEDTAVKHITILLEKLTINQELSLQSMLTSCGEMYKKYKECFYFALSHFYTFERDIKGFFRKINIEPLELPDPDLSFFGKIISTKCYQSFFCLYNIATSFPFYFEPNMEDVEDNNLLSVELVLPTLNCIPSLFDLSCNEELINDLKTAFSALHFLHACLYSTKIISIFVPWIFENISKLNEPQIYCMSHILISLFKTHKLKKILFAYAIKYNFLDKITECLKRNLPNGPFKNNYYYILYKLMLKFWKVIPRIRIIADAIFVEQICNDSVVCPFYNKFNNFLTISQVRIKPLKFSFPVINNVQVIVNDFIYDLQQVKPFWITCYNTSPLDRDDISEIITQYMKAPRVVAKTNFSLPPIPSVITNEMESYLATEEKWASKAVKKLIKYPNNQENHAYLNQIINNLIQINKTTRQNSIQTVPYKTPIDPYDYFSTEIYNESLCEELITEAVFLQQVDLKFIKLIRMMTFKDNVALLFKQYISDFLYQDQEFLLSSPLIMTRICLLINEILKSNKKFQQNFMEDIGNRLIELANSSCFQKNQSFLLNLSNLLLAIKSKLPISASFIVGSIFTYYPQLISQGLALYSMIQNQEAKPTNVLPIIENRFKIEIENENPDLQRLKLYLSSIPQLKSGNMTTVIKLLDKSIDNYKSGQYNDRRHLEFIIGLFNCLAPKYELYQQELYKMHILGINKPQQEKAPKLTQEMNGSYLNPPSPILVSTSPSFWKDAYEKNLPFLNDLFKKDDRVFYRFTFLQEYNKLLKFNLRYLFFKRTMNDLVSQGNRFTLQVSHQDVFKSTFKEWSHRNPRDFISNFCIKFIGEKGSDAGGLTRDWFTCITKEMFNEKLGLFTKNELLNYHPSTKVEITPINLEYYKMSGAIIALALVRGQKVNAHLSIAILKELLHQRVELDDLKEFDQSLYNNLLSIKNIEDVEPLELYFSIDEYENGQMKSHEFIKDGDQIQVTNENRIDYINYYAEYKIKETVVRQLSHFRDGFESIISFEQIKMFTPTELDSLICGANEISIEDMKKYVQLNGNYNMNHKTIKIFFNVISKWSQEDLSKLLYFVTGSSQLGINGFKELRDDGHAFTISSVSSKDRLPVAHTCYNTLDLPMYDNEKDMSSKLLMAMQETHFGLA